MTAFFIDLWKGPVLIQAFPGKCIPVVIWYESLMINGTINRFLLPPRW